MFKMQKKYNLKTKYFSEEHVLKDSISELMTTRPNEVESQFINEHQIIEDARQKMEKINVEVGHLLNAKEMRDEYEAFKD